MGTHRFLPPSPSVCRPREASPSAPPNKGELSKMLAEYLSKAKGAKADENATIIFGLRTCFGGGKSTCFALVYDNVDAAKKMEPKYRQIRSGFQEANSVKIGRKQRKEKKNREKKFRGTRKEKRVPQARIKCLLFFEHRKDEDDHTVYPHSS